MSLSTPRSQFGVHSFTPYSRVDGSYYGILKILESSSIAVQGQQVDLYGGSNKFAWQSETGQITSDLTLKLGQFEDFCFTLFFGKAPTPGTTEASGNVTALTNKFGTLVQATTGLASIAVTTAADLKFGKYVVIATAAKKVKIYAASDVDFLRGTDGSYVTDSLDVVAEITFADTGDTQAISGHGLTITGGSGTLAFVVGSSATFDVRPINVKSSLVSVGGSSDVFPEFGAIILAQHRANDEMMEIDALRCKAAGMPIGFDSFQWAKPDVKVKMLYDAAQNAVFKYRYVAPTTP